MTPSGPQRGGRRPGEAHAEQGVAAVINGRGRGVTGSSSTACPRGAGAQRRADGRSSAWRASSFLSVRSTRQKSPRPRGAGESWSASWTWRLECAGAPCVTAPLCLQRLTTRSLCRFCFSSQSDPLSSTLKTVALNVVRRFAMIRQRRSARASHSLRFRCSVVIRTEPVFSEIAILSEISDAVVTENA